MINHRLLLFLIIFTISLPAIGPGIGGVYTRLAWGVRLLQVVPCVKRVVGENL